VSAAQHPFDQSAYQVRFDWGIAGFHRLAASDIVVVIDVLGFGAAVLRASETGQTYPLDASAHPERSAGAAVARAAARSARGADRAPLVVIGGVRNASAVAVWAYAEQERRAQRTSIAVIACGGPTEPPSGAVRFAVEDHLGAGAVIDALGALGIDHSSPEAAVAGEAFHALRRAATHLITASGSGRALAAAGRSHDVKAAATVDAASVVPVLHDGVFDAR
jgi:2-phosphosulfolactate phosphatase